MSCESDVCRQDIPYPIVSQESVASILGNLTSALYGTVTKTVVDGRVVWTTCDLNQQATVFGIPRNSGEGLMCYFLRAFQDTRAIITPTAPAVNQLLRSVQAGSQSLSWIGYSSTATQNTIALRDNTGSSGFYDLNVAGTLVVSGSSTFEGFLETGLGITFSNGSIQTTAGITSLTGDVTGSPISNGSAPATVVAIRGTSVSATSPSSGQVLKYNGTQWAPASDALGITALTGDVVASGTGSVVATLANSGVVARNYGSANYVAAFTVDAKGRITSASELNITPAAIGAMPVFSNLSIALGGTGASTQQDALNAIAGAVTSGQYLRGTGANVTMSAIQAADVPTLNQNTTGTSSNVTGVISIANGGTGQTTRQNAMDALAGAVTSGQYLRGNGADVVMSAIQVADVPTLNQNTTGTASNVTGTVAIANGGTGSTTAAGARTALGVDASGTTVLKAGDTMSGPLTISTSGTAASLSVSGAVGQTAACVSITNQGTGNSFVVNDVISDPTPFVIDASGRVGIAIQPSTFALDVYNKNQTTDSVARFSYDAAGTRTAALIITSNGTVECSGMLNVGGTLGIGASSSIYFDVDGTTQTTAGITSLTGDVTTVGAGASAATVARIQGRNVASTAPTSGQVLAWNGTAWAPAAGGGSGTVTSVAFSGGTTGFTVTGSPISTSGTITLGGTLGVANGGTGATTVAGARTALGVDASGTTVLKTGDTMSGQLTITTNGTGSSLAVSNAATATSDCVTITNQGTGRSLIVNDVSGDITPFIIHAGGEVAIGTTDTPAAVLSIKQTIFPAIKILSGVGATGDLIKYQHNTSTLKDFLITKDSEITCWSVVANSGIQANTSISITDGITIGATSVNFSSVSQSDVGEISRGYYETTSTQATVTINAGTQKTYSITVTNAALQDFALASLNVSAGNTDATALQITAHVHAANTVIVVIRNSTASNVTLTTPTIKVRVWKS